MQRFHQHRGTNKSRNEAKTQNVFSLTQNTLSLTLKADNWKRK